MLMKELLESIAGCKGILNFHLSDLSLSILGGARSYHSHVTLNRLSNRESSAMVDSYPWHPEY